MIQKKYRFYIGIDPDVDKSGFAIVDKEEKYVRAFASYDFFDLISTLNTTLIRAQQEGIDSVVIIEAGWKNQITNYHTATGKGGQRIALNVGRNQQVGILLVEYCKRQGIDVIEATPLRKGWKGPNGKITHEELAYFTGITEKTNQEIRDSILLAWEYANLPIKINVNIKK